jgi:thiol-disulfide isomerase/thioredoxin
MTDTFRFTRRAAVGALATAALTPSRPLAQTFPSSYETARWSRDRAFISGPLAADSVARNFMAAKGEMIWPETPVLGPKGRQTLADWRGKTLLVTLWAEWCAPCVAEMPALARLNARYAGRRFEILPIATGSHTIKSVEDAAARLSRVPGADIASLVDASERGNSLMMTLGEERIEPPNLPKGATASSGALPCLVVVDPAGRVRGRALGLPMINGKNLWELPVGEGFIKLLASGAVA